MHIYESQTLFLTSREHLFLGDCHMRTVSVNLVLFCAVISTAVVNAVEVKTFDSDLQDWSLISGAGPGWINANLTAGNAAGEAGGTFDSGDTLADTTLGGTFTLDDTFSASGEFYIGAANIGNDAIAFGFINTGSGPGQTVGFHIADGLRFWASFATATSFFSPFEPNRGTNFNSDINGPNANITASTAYQFEISYNPSAGVNGVGRVTVKLKDTGGTQIGIDSTYDLSGAQRAEGASLNAFGVEAYMQGSLDFRVDNVTYTTLEAVPEPNSMLLMLFGTVALWAVRRNK
jgi:hypothetical protein